MPEFSLFYEELPPRQHKGVKGSQGSTLDKAQEAEYSAYRNNQKGSLTMYDVVQLSTRTVYSRKPRKVIHSGDY